MKREKNYFFEFWGGRGEEKEFFYLKKCLIVLGGGGLYQRVNQRCFEGFVIFEIGCCLVYPYKQKSI